MQELAIKALNRIASKLPIGSVVRLKDDYAGECHEIYGYAINADTAYIDFRDGSKLSLVNVDHIVEVM